MVWVRAVVAGGKATFLEGCTGTGHTAKAAASSLTCASPVPHLQLPAFLALQSCSLQDENLAAWDQRAEKGEGGVRVSDWFTLEMLSPSFPIPLALVRTEAVEEEPRETKNAQAVMGDNGRHPVFQKSRQLPSVALRLLLSSL